MANKINDAFENVKANPTLKQSTIQFLEKKKKKKQPMFSYVPIGKTVAAVCAMVLILIGIGGYSWLLTPVSYVSIDINPSMELALNRLDRVVSVTSYNPQGDELIKNLHLKGKKYIQAIYMITENDRLKQYLQLEEELVLTVAADSSKTALKAGVEQCCSHIGHGTRSVSVDVEVAQKAHDNGLSVGKYSAYLQLSQYDDSVTIDQCKKMSMAQIHSQIIEHEHGTGHGHGKGTNNTSEDTNQMEQEGEQETESDTEHGQETVSETKHEQGINTETEHEQEIEQETEQQKEEESEGHRHRRRRGHHGYE